MSEASAAGKLTPPGRAWATHAGLLVVQIAFASQAVEAKVAMMPRALGGEEIFPSAIAMVRMMGGALFFQALVRITATQESAKKPIPRSDHLRLAVLSFLGISANQALFLLGLRWTTPFAVSLLGATIPVLTAALAVVFGKEKLSLPTAAGIALALAGVLSLTGIGSVDKGALLVAINCLSYSLYVVHSREVVLRVGTIRAMAWIFTYGALSFLPLGIGPLVEQVPLLTTRGLLFFAYVIIVPTIVAYGVHAWALARSSATLVTIYIYLQPLIAALLAWVQLGHGVPLRAGIAAILILGGLGVVVATRAGPTSR